MIPLEQIKARHVIFDLDGTLIDSAPAILASFAKAFEHCGKTPVIPLTQTLIGPPLMQTLSTLAGTNNRIVLNSLAEAFMSHYDNYGYQMTTLFSGIPEMISGLLRRGHELYIATNKRSLPTQKIIELFGWQNCFKAFCSLDSFSPAIATKEELLSNIIMKYQLPAAEALYVGDRHEDFLAASKNGLQFMMADWGYTE